MGVCRKVVTGCSEMARRRAPFWSAVAASMAICSPAYAQDESRQVLSDAAPCFVGEIGSVSDPEGDRAAGVTTLAALCRGTAVIIGEADSYEVHSGKDPRSALVELVRRTNRHVWLVTFPEAGPPAVQELSGQIAFAAGRSATSSLRDLTVDVSSFPMDGEISVDVASAGGRASGTGQVKIDLRSQIEESLAAPSDRANTGGAAQ